MSDQLLPIAPGGTGTRFDWGAVAARLRQAHVRPFKRALEATLSPSTGDFRLRGRGAAHGEARLGPFSLVGELDLRDTDVDSLRERPAVARALARGALAAAGGELRLEHQRALAGGCIDAVEVRRRTLLLVQVTTLVAPHRSPRSATKP